MTARLKADLDRAWSYHVQLGSLIPRTTATAASGAPTRGKPGSRLLVRAEIIDLRAELETFLPDWSDRARFHLDPEYRITISAQTGYVCPHCRMPALIGWPNRGIIRCDPRYQGCATSWRGEADWYRLEGMLEDQRPEIEVVHVYGEPRLRQRGPGGRFEPRRRESLA